jgi:NhaP-type Na+/H+ or K+/H+ antiporter
LILVLGPVGLGFVCGWLMAWLFGQALRSPRTIFVLSVATLLLAVEALFLAGKLALLLSLSMVVLSFVLSLAWQHRLRKRYGPRM